jgi:hypothetical protein
MESIFAAVKYQNENLINEVRQDANKKFSGNSYVKNLWVLKEYKRRGGKVSYKGEKPAAKKIKKQIDASIDEQVFAMVDEFEESDSKKNEGKKLNKPFRLPSGSKKKFGVYVKNDKGNIVMVKFGDPNMEIKRDDPERRKSFRARHNCDNAGPKWKARYWACKTWTKTPVSKIVGSSIEVSFEEEIDWDNLPTQEDFLKENPQLIAVEEIIED